MTTADLDRLHTTGVITTKERQVLELHPLSDRTIALALDISRSAVRDRRENATRKIAAAHQRKAPT